MFTSVQIRNYRSAEDTGVLPLGALTVIVGRNNSGKSTLLRALYLIQQGAPWVPTDTRVDADAVSVELGYDQLALPEATPPFATGLLRLVRKAGSPDELHLIGKGGARSAEPVTSVEPQNLIFPTLAGRRMQRQDEQIRREAAMQVSANDESLAARAARFTDQGLADSIEYRDLCKRVLDIELSVVTGPNGQRVGIGIDKATNIGLDAMGTGLTAVLGLLMNMTGAHGKVFLIEEPETDLHPSALKALLDVIVEKSTDNQFILTTHSSTVLLRLGGRPKSIVLEARGDNARPPASTYRVIRDREARLEVLADLGYELADLDLADGWLIFEESSAERLCRAYLIPWFAPGLLRLQTIGAKGASRVGPLAHDYAEMLLFAHLEHGYKHRAWVVVDGDTAGTTALESLRREYEDWPEDHLLQWPAPNFEHFYPDPFRAQAAVAMDVHGRQARHEAKQRVLHDLLAWIAEDDHRARTAFEESAAPVIALLVQIEATLAAMRS